MPVDSDDSSASSSDEAPSNHANDSQHNQLTNSVEHNDQANDAEKGDLPVFTFDDMNKLLEAVKKEMPEHDLLKFNTRLEKLDWNRVKLPNFTAEESKKLFYHAISYIRKFKTLTEIIGEAQQAASKPTAKMYRVSKGGQRPKHPSSSYMVSFRSNVIDSMPSIISDCLLDLSLDLSILNLSILGPHPN